MYVASGIICGPKKLCLFIIAFHESDSLVHNSRMILEQVPADINGYYFIQSGTLDNRNCPEGIVYIKIS